MRFLPVFLDTCAGVVILVGSGEPACGKLRLLRAAGAHVRWFSRDVDVAEEMLTLSGPGRLEISFGDPLKADLSDAVVVVSAVGDGLDAQIAARARRHRIPVNVVDRPELSFDPANHARHLCLIGHVGLNPNPAYLAGDLLYLLTRA